MKYLIPVAALLLLACAARADDKAPPRAYTEAEVRAIVRDEVQKALAQQPAASYPAQAYPTQTYYAQPYADAGGYGASVSVGGCGASVNVQGGRRGFRPFSRFRGRRGGCE